MPERKIYDQYGLNFVTFTIVDWVDIFTRKVYCDLILESLKYCQREKKLHIHAFVIMSNHVHLVVSAEEDNCKLSDIIRDFKKFTSKKIVKTIKLTPESRRKWMLEVFEENGRNNSDNEKYQVWQQGTGVVGLWSMKIIWQKINYIHFNPVKAGWVFEPQDYVYSSAGAYLANQKCLVDIDFLPPIRPVKWFWY